jgi:hypothetical protein
MEHTARPEPRSPAAPVSLKSLALPSEHGGWGLLLEPALLGLALAPSWGGAGFVVAALAAFLARHPLRLALSDRWRGTRYPRTALAERIALAYLAVAAAGVALAAWRSPLVAFAPLAAAAPLGLLQLAYDARLRGRQLVPELAGGVALGATAAAVAIAGGWNAAAAFALWLLLAARTVGSVTYVRARLRAARGLAPGRAAAWACHVAALALVAALAARGLAPWLALAAFVALLARALLGLREGARALPPRAIGFQEMGYGVLTLVLLVAGYGWRP